MCQLWWGILCCSVWKKSVARCCHRPSGISLGSISYMAWVALYWVHILHHFTYSVLSAFMPGQQTVSLMRQCIFSVPLCPQCSFLRVLSWYSGEWRFYKLWVVIHFQSTIHPWYPSYDMQSGELHGCAWANHWGSCHKLYCILDLFL